MAKILTKAFLAVECLEEGRTSRNHLVVGSATDFVVFFYDEYLKTWEVCLPSNVRYSFDEESLVLTSIMEVCNPDGHSAGFVVETHRLEAVEAWITMPITITVE